MLLRCALIISLSGVGQSLALAQSPPNAKLEVSRSVGQSQSFYKGTVIPDPNNPLAISVLAVNPSVAKELGLNQAQVKALKDVLREASGALDSVSVTVRALPGEEGPSAAERDEFYRQTILQRRKLVDEILSPDELNRLRQIAYQIEVARMGLGAALTDGKLSKEVGVHENQRTSLRNKAARIEEKTRMEIKRVLAQAQAQLLSELPTEQRNRARELLGTPFYFQDDDYRLRDPKRYAE